MMDNTLKKVFDKDLRFEGEYVPKFVLIQQNNPDCIKKLIMRLQSVTRVEIEDKGKEIDEIFGIKKKKTWRSVTGQVNDLMKE